MRTLPLTVLAHEGPLLRAYLVRMRRAGWQPQRLVLVLPASAPGGRPLAPWLPGPWRRTYLGLWHRLAQYHWPHRLRSLYPHLIAAMAAALEPACPDAAGQLAEMYGPFRLAAYAASLESLLVTGLADPRLAAALRRAPTGAILYTGGGFVPRRLLEEAGAPLLHVHPGCLPDVRGADGLLWSLLLSGRPAASAFYMATGIDAGGVVAVHTFPQLVCPLPPGRRPDDHVLYQAVFTYWDPLLRAETLVARVLPQGHGNLGHLPATAQAASHGVTFHFMHPLIRHRALARLFPTAAEAAPLGVPSSSAVAAHPAMPTT